MATIVRGKNANRPYTVRYYHDGKQRERSFRTRAEARDWLVKFEHDSREQTFVDPKVAGERFGVVAQRWLARHPGSPSTLGGYERMLRLHILPVFGDRPLAYVATARVEMEYFLRETLPAKGLGASAVRICYITIRAIVGDSIKAGRLGPNADRIKGIELPDLPTRAEIPFASHEQINVLAEKMPAGYLPSILLMRGCGLRLGEALGVRYPEDFSRDAHSLRLSRQLAPDGKSYVPLKHRNEGDYRDVPVPGYVLGRYWPNERLMPVNHRTYRHWFYRARDAAGLPSTFTPHTLRHIYASVCLAGGIPITDVSKWLGHRDINVTYQIYGHLVPASWERARGVLDAEWES